VARFSPDPAPGWALSQPYNHLHRIHGRNCAVVEAQLIDALARSLPALAVGRISAPVSVEIPDRTAPRLAAIPGVGPIAASSFDMSSDWNPPSRTSAYVERYGRPLLCAWIGVTAMLSSSRTLPSRAAAISRAPACTGCNWPRLEPSTSAR
jgi:hypothetical protein